ncbi:mitochondrial small ribosomal subunit rsm22 domain-containing protein [Ditylenchus destructor]|uniref:Mitochondrial small ribosomal subunit rsm22 domain-containing protein n=1 Tax=Ditylenchus destructor TaxID=166010 RepID=A0AAD4MP78_9BILA|nr:mitochondrial small ribosomal subunit rsm22 domain-containing protein [Ditylenchus destructor]
MRPSILLVCKNCISRSLRYNSSVSAVIPKSNKHPKQAAKAELWLTEDGITDRQTLNRDYAFRRCHVTSVNMKSGQKSILRLTHGTEHVRYDDLVVACSDLPDEAKEGLIAVLKQCKQHPKAMQGEADVLSRKLEGRKFPPNADEIRLARAQVVKEIMEQDMELQYEMKNMKKRRFLEKLIYEKAHRELAKQRYHWKPLTVNSYEQAAVFALSRFGGYFTEMRRVLAEFGRNNFVPNSVLDYGSGVGGAFWAAQERWGDAMQHYCLVDPNLYMRQVSMDIMRGSQQDIPGAFVNKGVYFRKNILPSPQNTYDLVICHRTLIEMPTEEERIALVEMLWQRATKYLVIVDTHMADSFKELMKIRDHIINGGSTFDYEFVKNALDEKNLLDLNLIKYLSKKDVADYDKLQTVQKLLGDDFEIPTKLDPGFVYAPCPHDKRCPMLSRGACKFKVRWMERRADHRTESINRDGTLTDWFSYVIFEKGQRPKETFAPRILDHHLNHHVVNCQVCTQNNGLQGFDVSKRAEEIYRRVKSAKIGQLLTVQEELIKRGPSPKSEISPDAILAEEDIMKMIENMPSITKLIEEIPAEEEDFFDSTSVDNSNQEPTEGTEKVVKPE